jgi:hypothetical protein
VDVNTTGYVTFNDATKILLQYQGNHKVEKIIKTDKLASDP